jgi:hypothetical protein
MSAEIKPFPGVAGDLFDHNVQVIQQVFAERGKPMTDAEAKAYTLRFEEGRRQIALGTAGMSSSQRRDYLVGQITDLLNETPPTKRGNVRHLKISKRKVADATEQFFRDNRLQLCRERLARARAETNRNKGADA